MGLCDSRAKIGSLKLAYHIKQATGWVWAVWSEHSTGWHVVCTGLKVSKSCSFSYSKCSLQKNIKFKNTTPVIYCQTLTALPYYTLLHYISQNFLSYYMILYIIWYHMTYIIFYISLWWEWLLRRFGLDWGLVELDPNITTGYYSPNLTQPKLPTAQAPKFWADQIGASGQPGPIDCLNEKRELLCGFFTYGFLSEWNNWIVRLMYII